MPLRLTGEGMGLPWEDMTIQERLIWVKRLNIAQFVINLAVFFFVGVVGLSIFPVAFLDQGFGGATILSLLIPIVWLFIFAVAAFHIALPLLANLALSQRTKGWTGVAYAILTYVTITGGGIITVLSLIALVLLFDGPTYEYLTGEPWSRARETSQPLQDV